MHYSFLALPLEFGKLFRRLYQGIVFCPLIAKAIRMCPFSDASNNGHDIRSVDYRAI